MNKKILFYSFTILLLIGYSQHYANPNYSGGLLAQNDPVKSSQNIKKEKKKKMRDVAKADDAALKRHQNIQTKATRKRMKKNLKKTLKNVKNSNR